MRVWWATVRRHELAGAGFAEDMTTWLGKDCLYCIAEILVACWAYETRGFG